MKTDSLTTETKVVRYGFCRCGAFARVRKDGTWSRHRARKTWTHGPSAPICQYSLTEVPPEQAA